MQQFFEQKNYAYSTFTDNEHILGGKCVAQFAHTRSSTQV